MKIVWNVTQKSLLLLGIVIVVEVGNFSGKVNLFSLAMKHQIRSRLEQIRLYFEAGYAFRTSQ